MRKITTTDKVRSLLAQGMAASEIAQRIGVRVNRVHVIRWQDARRGADGLSWSAQYMRKLRRDNPDYCEREKDAQSKAYFRRKLIESGGVSP